MAAVDVGDHHLTWRWRIIVVVLLVMSCSMISFTSSGCRQNYTSIISFGDSFADTGNLLRLSQLPDHHFFHCGFPPYGNSYFHVPTGRCSDGRLVLDFIAQRLGLPLVPPIFGSSEVQNVKQGMNFAVGSATALDFSFYEERGIHNLDTNISLNVQLNLFKKLLPSFCSTFPECNEFLGNSVIVMGEIGGNDYLHAFRQGMSFEQVRELVPLVVNTIGSAIKEVIQLGAVTILVPGDVPTGCMPSYLTHFHKTSSDEDYDPSTGCLLWLNKFVEYQSELLQIELSQIRQLYPDARIIYADYYNAAMSVYRSPRKFGFAGEVITKACCGAGGPYNYNYAVPCGNPDATSLCDNPSQYVSWDGVHFTEAFYRLLAEAILEGPYTVPPFNYTSCVESEKYYYVKYE